MNTNIALFSLLELALVNFDRLVVRLGCMQVWQEKHG